jgi:hypothetical protein
MISNNVAVKKIFISDDAQTTIIITTKNTPWLYDFTGDTGEWIILPSHFVADDVSVNERMSFTVSFAVGMVCCFVDVFNI